MRPFTLWTHPIQTIHEPTLARHPVRTYYLHIPGNFGYPIPQTTFICLVYDNLIYASHFLKPIGTHNSYFFTRYSS